MKCLIAIDPEINNQKQKNSGLWGIKICETCDKEFSFYKCQRKNPSWALNNLQPLWAKENLSKGGINRKKCH